MPASPAARTRPRHGVLVAVALAGREQGKHSFTCLHAVTLPPGEGA
ncbi:hypothetical protein [Micromonospora avicenniae]|uniref:Uncharacterized protein n=1 Tax=Micromonospora avicenniae TaxID=1198245 RepID=A0A1N7F587_9ACTN|nr:hypothetical protein [Micromonospora avicenniae]SIR95527.1 hypothetical protein SAMN05444858_13060 [Micromonospora avicenniae]